MGNWIVKGQVINSGANKIDYALIKLIFWIKTEIYYILDLLILVTLILVRKKTLKSVIMVQKTD